ncbi:alkaline phosphatase family protein [bacterium]|nr:alkaline phosphatase family protein [bacterium]
MTNRMAAGYLLMLLLLLAVMPVYAENVVLVIIDGARYSETFGDPTRAHIPEMEELAERGAIVDEFYNDEYTWTSRAVPAIWCGDWTDVRDTTYQSQNTQYTLSPSIFEYFRHDTNAPADECYYVLKSLSSLWLPSFHPEYGPDYWPTFYSEGWTDLDVLDNAIDVLHDEQPQLMLVYFADVDHAGHSGVWNDYIAAIETADYCVSQLWNAIQADDHYRDNTVMMVTNDHGRHDDQHGGFSGHGDGCDGCRHIMMLAIGPEIESELISTEYRTIPDFAVTACEILGVDPAYAGGEVMDEIFVQNTTGEPVASPLPDQSSLVNVYPNPFNASTRISVTLKQPGHLRLDVFNLNGELITTISDGSVSAGDQAFTFSAVELTSGLYFVRATVPGQLNEVRKVMLIH